MALGLTSVKITLNSCHCGIALTSLQLPEKSLVLGIVRDNQLMLASAEPIIWYGDYLLAIALSQPLLLSETLRVSPYGQAAPTRSVLRLRGIQNSKFPRSKLKTPKDVDGDLNNVAKHFYTSIP